MWVRRTVISAHAVVGGRHHGGGHLRLPAFPHLTSHRARTAHRGLGPRQHLDIAVLWHTRVTTGQYWYTLHSSGPATHPSLLTVAYWPQATDRMLLTTYYWPQVTDHRLLTTGYWPQATDHRLLTCWSQGWHHQLLSITNHKGARNHQPKTAQTKHALQPNWLQMR